MKHRAIDDLASVLGRPCWQVRWDNQVGLDMNFGPPTMTIEEPSVSKARSARVRAIFARRRVFLRGTHWVVIRPTAWTIELRDGLRARSSSSKRRRDLACNRLTGEKLIGIIIDGRSGGTEFRFDLGARIVVRGTRNVRFSEFDIWSLHVSRRNRFVAIYSGGGYTSGPLSGNGDGVHPISSASENKMLVIGSRAAGRAVGG